MPGEGKKSKKINPEYKKPQHTNVSILLALCAVKQALSMQDFLNHGIAMFNRIGQF